MHSAMIHHDEKSGYAFWHGMASLLDLGTTLRSYDLHLLNEQTAFDSLRSDWIKTGRDLRSAMVQFEEKELHAAKQES